MAYDNGRTIAAGDYNTRTYKSKNKEIALVKILEKLSCRIVTSRDGTTLF